MKLFLIFVCEALQALSMLLRSFQALIIVLNMEVSGFSFLNLVCGGPDAQGVDHSAATSWVSKPSLLMRAFTLPVGVLHISTVL